LSLFPEQSVRRRRRGEQAGKPSLSLLRVEKQPL